MIPRLLCCAQDPHYKNGNPESYRCACRMHNPLGQVPPLELLLAFEAAARHLSFTKAGEELSLTQSAVSRQIQALEESLGGKRSGRRTRALLLTEKGQVLYKVAQEVLQQLDDTTRKMRETVAARTVTVST